MQRHGFEHGFPLIRSLRASAQRSTSVLFSFALSLLIVAGSFVIRQSKTILGRSEEWRIGDQIDPTSIFTGEGNPSMASRVALASGGAAAAEPPERPRQSQ